MASRTSQLIAELVDRVSGPAGNIQKSLNSVGAASKKALTANTRDNPLGQRGSVALIDRVKKLDRETATFAKRYEIGAQKSGKAWSHTLTATSAAMLAQGRAAEQAGRKSETAFKRATAAAVTYHRATISPGGSMYVLGRTQRTGPTTPVLPLPASTTSRNRVRASEWMNARTAAAAAAGAAVAGGGADEDERGRRRRIGPLGAGLGGAGTTTAAWRLMNTSADQERGMRQTAVTAGAAESEILPAINRLKDLQRRWSVPYAEIKEDFDELITMGRSWAQAQRDIEGLTIARRAYGSGFARLSTLVGDNFDMNTPEGQAKALQIIAGGGKSGRFEVGDFTRRFPKLAPMLKSAGFKGEKGLTSSVAMMQILADRFGTADQAAVGMENLLGEFISPVTKGRFKKQGIDLDKVVADAEKQGQSGFDAVLTLLHQRTGGDERKLGDFFRNKNSLQAISALVTNFGKIPEKIAEVEKNAQTAMGEDASRFVQDSKAKLDSLSHAVKDASGLFGSFMAEHLTPFIERVANGLRNVMGQSLPDKERLEFLKRQHDQGGWITRLIAARGISNAEMRLGKNRDFSLANPGHRLSPTGVPVVGGGAFLPSDQLNRRAGQALIQGLGRSPLPSVHSGGVVSAGSLYSGALGPDSTASTPMARPQVDTGSADKARDVFDEIRDKMDAISGKTATPNVNTGPLERANQILREMIQNLNQVESGAARAVGAAQRASQGIRSAMRASYSDYGLEESG